MIEQLWLNHYVMPKLRVSAISFLNTAPLMWEFEHGGLGREYAVEYTLPSQCAELLRTDGADIGIIPAAAYADIPELMVIPDIAIAARGPVRSIFLISKVPVENIRTVAADTSSRSSVVLLRVLFSKFWGGNPEFVAMAPVLEPMLAQCDAGLLIGDPALLARTKAGSFHVFDLAEEWKNFTGKDFVFAFWAVRKGALAGVDTWKLVRDFQLSRDHGLEPANLETIAEEWSGRIGLSREEIINYLAEAIYYKLDEGCLEGLRLFYQYASECGALPQAPGLEFV